MTSPKSNIFLLEIDSFIQSTESQTTLNNNSEEQGQIAQDQTSLSEQQTREQAQDTQEQPQDNISTRSLNRSENNDFQSNTSDEGCIFNDTESELTNLSSRNDDSVRFAFPNVSEVNRSRPKSPNEHTTSVEVGKQIKTKQSIT